MSYTSKHVIEARPLVKTYFRMLYLKRGDGTLKDEGLLKVPTLDTCQAEMVRKDQLEKGA